MCAYETAISVLLTVQPPRQWIRCENPLTFTVRDGLDPLPYGKVYMLRYHSKPWHEHVRLSRLLLMESKPQIEKTYTYIIVFNHKTYQLAVCLHGACLCCAVTQVYLSAEQPRDAAS